MIRLSTPFDTVELLELPGSIDVPGASDVRLTVAQSESAKILMSMKLRGFPFEGAHGPHVVRAHTLTHDIEIDRAWTPNHSQSLNGGESDVAGHVQEAVITRRGSAFPRGVDAIFVLQGLAFFFSGRMSFWDVKFGGRTWRLRLRDEFFQLGAKLKGAGNNLMSATFTCVVSDHVDLAAAEETVHHVCDLLTYAVNSPVRLARVIVDDGDDKGPAFLKLRSQGAPGALPAMPLIPLDHEYDGGIRALLEHSFDRFAQLRDKYCLSNVMHLARRARATSDVSSVRGLLVANACEVLRFNYGHHVLVPAGIAEADGDDLFWLGPEPKKGKAHFAALLRHLADKVGVPWNDRVKELRNAVIHTGELPEGYTVEDVFEALHFIDSIVLSLLAWDDAPAANAQAKHGGVYLPCHRRQAKPPNFGNNIRVFSRVYDERA